MEAEPAGQREGAQKKIKFALDRGHLGSLTFFLRKKLEKDSITSGDLRKKHADALETRLRGKPEGAPAIAFDYNSLLARERRQRVGAGERLRKHTTVQVKKIKTYFELHGGIPSKI